MSDMNPGLSGHLGSTDGPTAGPGLMTPEQADSDRILDLLEEWEEFHRRGETPPEDWPGLADLALREELRRCIEDQQRIGALLHPPGLNGWRWRGR